ncbi:MAG: phosphoribosylformylglycinamidine synthase I [Legionellales bacterium]
MKIAIVQFPGSNCERETMLAVKRAGMIPVAFLWNESIDILLDMDGYILVGGFSYEDRSRAGIIAALDPVMNAIRIQSEKGKPVLGICNGAQILVETGLVPGLINNAVGMALTENKRVLDGKVLGTGFYNAWIHMRTCTNAKPNAFTRHLGERNLLFVPIAHAQGRFVIPEALLAEMIHEGLTLFQYCNDQGDIIDTFPINPNGSVNNIAAVVNKAGNVMAMMPHPERTPEGDAIFHSMRDYIQEQKTYNNQMLSYKPHAQSLSPYLGNPLAQELIVQLIITDNQALTVQNTLKRLGIPLKVQRMVHWQIDSSDTQVVEELKQSGILFNDRKEFLVSNLKLDHSCSKAYLVKPNDDLFGQQKLQIAQDHCSISGIHGIHHGILWIFTSEEASIQEWLEPILASHIISNPYAHKVYDYE